ncbi:MAG: pyruvate formate lyase family protein, partial [Erysipelotrichales bacterium]
MNNAWNGFNKGNWVNEIDVRDFILKNYTEYQGDDSFLAQPTENTKELWKEVSDLLDQETKNGGVLDADTSVVSDITSHQAGYIDKDREQIVGLQTDKPLKRALAVYGGIRTAANALKNYDYEIDSDVEEIFTRYRKTHNEGVFNAYTPEMKKARHSGVITGLPDAYGRGRIIGDYRRIALYGIDRLIEDKKDQVDNLPFEMNPTNIQLREELSDQMKALKELKVMASFYG